MVPDGVPVAAGSLAQGMTLARAGLIGCARLGRTLSADLIPYLPPTVWLGPRRPERCHLAMGRNQGGSDSWRERRLSMADGGAASPRVWIRTVNCQDYCALCSRFATAAHLASARHDRFHGSFLASPWDLPAEIRLGEGRPDPENALPEAVSGAEAPPGEWGDPADFELRAGSWWCTRCWKVADRWHVASAGHRRRASGPAPRGASPGRAATPPLGGLAAPRHVPPAAEAGADLSHVDDAREARLRRLDGWGPAFTLPAAALALGGSAALPQE